MIATVWMSETGSSGEVTCLACSHLCKIKPEKTGICGIRKNERGELKLLVYGRSVAAHTDPIEKKPLFHFYPTTPVYSIGTAGCNFRCDFCQNSDISQFHKDHSEQEIIQAGMDLLPEVIVNTCLRQSIQTIAYTYNEPAIFFEYAYDTAKLAHESGLKNIYVSNGFETRKALQTILPYLDGINVDLKSFNPNFYRKLCGGTIDPVLENIHFLWTEGVWVEVTTLVIPGHNDTDEEFEKISDFLFTISPDLPWHISRFHPCYKMSNVPATSLRSLERAYEIGKRKGLRYVYIGNTPHEKAQSTFCHSCGKELISRNGYSVKNSLRNGKCPSCGTPLPGRFQVQD